MNPSEIINASRRYTRGILFSVILYVPLILCFSAFNTLEVLPSVQLGISFIFIPLELLAAILSIKLARYGSTDYSKLLCWVGILIIAGGIWFDVIATILNTPDLSLEGNPIARLFLDSGFPIGFVYIFSFIAQSLLTVISCALWIALVRHYSVYMQVVWEFRPRSVFEFLSASLGGNTRFGRTTGLDVSKSYRIFWWAALWLATSFSRWALGFSWVKVLPNSLAMGVVYLEKLVVVLIFFVHLAAVYFSQRGNHQMYDPQMDDGSRNTGERVAVSVLAAFISGVCSFIACTCGAVIVFFPASAMLNPDPWFAVGTDLVLSSICGGIGALVLAVIGGVVVYRHTLQQSE